MRTFVSLPLPTNRTFKGPLVSFAGGTAVVEYDWEDEEGNVQAARVTFLTTVAIRFRDSSCYSAEDVHQSGVIVVEDATDYLKETLASRTRFDDPRSDPPLSSARTLRHFHLYFDDAGAVDIVAGRVTSEMLTP